MTAVAEAALKCDWEEEEAPKYLAMLLWPEQDAAKVVFKTIPTVIKLVPLLSQTYFHLPFFLNNQTLSQIY